MLETAIRAAREAGKIVKENHGKVREKKVKGGNWHEVVTNVDMESNRKILEILKSKYPEHNIISEETKQKKTDSPYCWYIDPIDGTTNYTLNLFFSSVCVGLTNEGKILLGVVYNPLTGEMFVGEKGKGATLNGKPIKPSDNSDLKATVVNYCHPNTPEETRKIEKLFFELKTKSRDMRRLGSAGLDMCYVACGRNDVNFHTNTTLTPWDFVAGVAIAREAGATVTDWENRPWALESKTLLATNGKLHQEMLDILTRR
jgi:myo-inositol-1(or 4)-monophosphatase